MCLGGTVRLTQVVRRLGVSSTVVALIEGVNHFFDYILSPALIFWLGPFQGGTTFFVIAFVSNYLLVVWYKRTTADWFGFEWLRLKEKTGSKKLVELLLKKARPVTYIGLCVYDPTYGFIYQQGRKSGSHFSPTDWGWFVLSNLIGILVWIVFMSGTIEGIKHLWN